MTKPHYLRLTQEELWKSFTNERDNGIRDRIKLREEIARLENENRQLREEITRLNENQTRSRDEFVQKEEARRSKGSRSVALRDLWRSAPMSIPCSDRKDAERMRNLMYLAVAEYRRGRSKHALADRELLDAIDNHSLTVTDNALLIRRKSVDSNDGEGPLPDWLAPS